MDIRITFGSIDEGGNYFTYLFRGANKKIIEACETAYAEIYADLHRKNYETIKKGENDVTIVGHINRANHNIQLMSNKEDFEIRMDLLPAPNVEATRFLILEAIGYTILTYNDAPCIQQVWDDISHLSVICERLKNSRLNAMAEFAREFDFNV